MESVSYEFEAIGTSWKIDVPAGASASDHGALLENIRRRAAAFDADYSRFRPDSLVTRMSRQAGIYNLPADAEKIFAVYRSLYDVTGGLFTPLIGRTLESAGYDATYSLKPRPELEPALGWDEALTLDFPTLAVRRPVLIDIGAAGKGYLVDIVGELIRAADISRFAINAGGDILFQGGGGGKLRIGLEDPANPAQAIGVVELAAGSLCASAGNRRAWGDFHHIINPATLASPRHVAASWVAADEAIIADALATALFLVEPERLAEIYDFEYVILGADRRVRASRGFPGELFA